MKLPLARDTIEIAVERNILQQEDENTWTLTQFGEDVLLLLVENGEIAFEVKE